MTPNDHPATTRTERSAAAPSATVTYDLAVWREVAPISAAAARTAYLALADESLPAPDPALISAFVEQLIACFPDVVRDALPPAPGSHNAFLAAIACECYVYDAGAYLSFPADLAPDVTPLVCHLADQHGLVVYDRQRQGVFLPSVIDASWHLRATAGDGFVVAHDPTAAELPALLDAADQSNWFLVLERDDDHFVQAAPAARAPGEPRRWFVEYRDGEQHLQAEGASLDLVKQVFVLYAVGGGRWKDLLTWSPLA